MLLAEERRVDVDLAPITTTHALRMVAVERVIQTMKTRLHEPLTLEDMADIAYMSSYHFCRVFHQVIGIPPGEFLASLRLNEAKRLLLTTSLSVTDVCFEVGYSGLGSFTTRFTQLVGLPPRLLRRLAHNADMSHLAAGARGYEPERLIATEAVGVTGSISAPETFKGCICVGLFPKPVPQGRPAACTRLSSPGAFHISPVPAGRYYLLIAAFPHSPNPGDYLLPGESVLVGVHGPIEVVDGMSAQIVDVALRPHRATDPPIIVAVPFL